VLRAMKSSKGTMRKMRRRTSRVADGNRGMRSYQLALPRPKRDNRHCWSAATNGTRYPGAATVSVWALSFLDRLDALRIELAKELGRDTARG